MDLNIRIGGEAGQGLVSLGDILTGAMADIGINVFTGKSYMSRVRGGLNWFDVRISDSELFALKKGADLLVALSKDAGDILQEYMSPDGVLIENTDNKENKKKVVSIDFVKTAGEIAGSKVMANSVAAGAIFGILGYDPDALFTYLKKVFKDKGEEIVRKNLDCAENGYKKVTEKNLKLEAPKPSKAPGEYISGAAAMALSAASAGIKFFCAYPMTPGTATFAGVAALSDKYGILVEQAEDELAAINMICGAAYAGVPAMTATSGGGFALMTEGLSLAGMMELPVVIVIAQRPGPATGLPTRTAQEDLKFAINAGHGEFTRMVFAPGTIQQCHDLTRRAIASAHKFQTPAIILTDQYLQDIQKNIGSLEAEYKPIDRHIITKEGKDYKRYNLDAGNISTRAIPGGKALVICDSDEHDEKGHLTEDMNIRISMQNKRMNKLDAMRSEFVAPDFYGSKDAELVLVCWGSTYGACREAVDLLEEGNESAAMLHYSQVWPLDIEKINKLFDKKNRQVVIVENNYSGQFYSLLRENRVKGECKLLNRYDGLPLTAEYIIEEMKK
jgi:2-oxoglutarate ferredoxin oxidoreductase subunit alpha